MFIQPGVVSNSQKKKLKANRNKPIKTYLLGQIGKNSAIEDNPINLKMILDEAFNKIEEARSIVGGRTVILECENCDKLVNHYEKHGFSKLQSDELLTMYAILPNN